MAAVSTKGETTEAVSAVLGVTVAGIEAQITATEVNGTGELQNTEPKAKVHAATGEVTMKYTNLHVSKPSGCEVAEPIEYTTTLEAIEEGEVIGLKLTPAEGSTFASITFEGKECSLADVTAHVTGSAVATGGATEAAAGTGATYVLEPAHESLAVGSNSASLSSTTTVKLTGGDPVAFTTIE